MSAVAEQTSVDVIPDSIEPYVGYKYLILRDDGVLLSPQGETEWPRGEKLSATCLNNSHPPRWLAVQRTDNIIDKSGWWSYGGHTHSMSAYAAGPSWTDGPPAPVIELPHGWSWSWEAEPHEAPDDNCGCGIYLVDSPKACEMYRGGNPSETRVLVKVALWGKTVIGDRGARGQYAYPLEIIVPGKIKGVAQKAGETYNVPVTEECKSTPSVFAEEMLFDGAPILRRKRTRSYGNQIAFGVNAVAVVLNFGAIVLLPTTLSGINALAIAACSVMAHRSLTRWRSA